MSTKQLLLSHNDFELYRDYLDEGHVWLAVRGLEFEATPSEVRIKMPTAVWEVVRKTAGSSLSEFDLTDEQIAKRVQACVDERLQDFAAESTGGEPKYAALFGALIFGPVENSRDEQITRGIKYYIAQREKQRGLMAQMKAVHCQVSVPSKSGTSYARASLSDRN
jgi:hypothetical protein